MSDTALKRWWIGIPTKSEHELRTLEMTGEVIQVSPAGYLIIYASGNIVAIVKKWRYYREVAK